MTHVKELLEGRRLGFALRPVLGALAIGLALAALLVDFAAWFAWGARDTNAFVWAGYWLVCGAIGLTLLGLLTALAELRDVPDQERSLARVDLGVAILALLSLGLSAGLRSNDLGAAVRPLAATPEIVDFGPNDGPFLSWSFCPAEGASGLVNSLVGRLRPVLQDQALACDVAIDPGARPAFCPPPAGTKDISTY